MGLADVLEELQARIGDEIHLSEWVTVSQEMIDAFDYCPEIDDVARALDEASLWYAAQKRVQALDDEVLRLLGRRHSGAQARAIKPLLAFHYAGTLPVYANTASRPKGKLIVSFRKEWAQDIKRRLEERKLPHTVRYLEALDRRGIVEAIQGPAAAERLREKYQLTIEPGLADTMAVQILADAGSAVAPTLQIRLGRMWEGAGSPPV